ncbi:hypothetical protein FACS1894190_10330 [Spirochaetia bacterium]|nr:hypothetical protein FACS1894190_10330 [Spirochaetia bacterium]
MARRSRLPGFFSPAGMCIYYPILVFLVVFAFRMIIPGGEKNILPVFYIGNRFSRAVIDYCRLFPAVFLSAMVLPFGIKQKNEIKYKRFSAEFLTMLRPQIISAIIATVFYGALFLLARPIAVDYQVSIDIQSKLFNTSKSRITIFIQREEWTQAAHFLALCQRIWKSNPDLVPLEEQVSTGLEYSTYARVREPINAADAPRGIPGQKKPVNAAEALLLAEKAYNEGRYYDSHWLAFVADEIAPAGSSEKRLAATASSKAWNAISRLEESASEKQNREIFLEKRQGYEAMNNMDWIRAYYIFNGMSTRVPDDPDVQNFLVMSREGLQEAAFFLDEIEGHSGNNLTGIVFSVPLWETRGRLVMRIEDFSTTADYSYGKGLEIVAFNENSAPLFAVSAPYIKITPLAMTGTNRTLIYLHALDRNDAGKEWKPVWSGDTSALAGDMQILLDMPYSDFLLASVAKVNDGFYLRDLWNAAKQLDNYGYVPEVFQAEMIHSIIEPLLFLPLAVLGIIIGWRFRTIGRARFIFAPMFVMLPVVFYVFSGFISHIFNSIGICLVISAGFTTAAIISVCAAVGLFLLSLVGLAAQHG